MESSLEEIGSWDYDMIANSTPYQLYEKYIESSNTMTNDLKELFGGEKNRLPTILL